MRDVDDYLNLLAAEHRGQPNYEAVISLIVSPFVALQQFLLDLPAAFDLDVAIGVQLDQVGEWLDRTRYIQTPLPDVYFSWDTSMLGWEQGVWQGPYDPINGLTALPDETFRLVLKAKVAADSWDGTNEDLPAILALLFPPGTGTLAFVLDNGDMTMTFGVAGVLPPTVFLVLLAEGFIPIKPEGVGASYVITSLPPAPIFGFDVESPSISGWDVGAWGTVLGTT